MRNTQYPSFYPTVDLAIVDFYTGDLLLARKPNQPLLRFMGGFMDPTKDKCAEDAAIREGKEETSLDLTVVGYAGSMLVDDPRYRDQEDKIMTFLYVMKYTYETSGTPVAMDDIELVTWRMFGTINESEIMPEHRPLIRMINKYFKNEVLQKVK